jgi:hypothetical protein
MYSLEGIPKRMKGQAIDKKMIFTNHIPDKEFVSRKKF